MNKIQIEVVYPRVERQFPNPSDDERQFFGEMTIGYETWKTSATIRKGFCEMIFAGCGNHPGLHDGQLDMAFDAGDPGVNSVHHQWKEARIRSMSVGDLIHLDPAGLNEWWMCDAFGFVVLTKEEVDSWLAYPRQYGCCSFEVRKWKKANNLPVD